jgi:ribosomal 50S subunit-recycling heat shock protein
MLNSYDVNSSGDVVTTRTHQRMQEVEINKPTENTSLSPNSNQTYFADERIQVPETTSVSWYFMSCLQMKVIYNRLKV